MLYKKLYRFFTDFHPTRLSAHLWTNKTPYAGWKLCFFPNGPGGRHAGEAACSEGDRKKLAKDLKELGFFQLFGEDFCDVQHFDLLFFAGVFDPVSDHGHAEGAAYGYALGPQPK